ncbi:LOW QUALITY PROTEIN: protein FAM161B [Neosynchiropus ocellatus]
MSVVESVQTEVESELILRQQLKCLSETLREQLQQTKRRHKDELLRRLHQNTLSSPDVSQIFKHEPAPQKNERIKQELDEAECLRQFRASPVPEQTKRPLYHQITELKERQREKAREQRKNFLLSEQKPFSFHEREKMKKEKTMEKLKQEDEALQRARNPHRRQQQVGQRNVYSDELPMVEGDCDVYVDQQQAPERPTIPMTPNLRTAERARREKPGFLYEKPSFHPNIIRQVPDFQRLHRNLQTDGLRRPQSTDGTKCQPFILRTSARPTRQRRMSVDNIQASSEGKLQRSKSLGTLKSLSSDTLPVYITDAVRRRSHAIRKSMELRESQSEEISDWFLKTQMKTQVLQKSVSLHAKLLDPHNSLKEVFKEKLQQHRAADQQRMKEYKRELRDINARVTNRPFLFEQLKQRDAKTFVENMYRKKLKEVGMKEEFVEENGRAADGASEDDEVHSK